MPLLEAFVDENQVMRFKLVSLPKNTAKLPILEVPSPSLSFNGPGIAQTLTPNTRNGSDAEAGYSFILHDATIANLTPVVVAKKRLPESNKREKRAFAKRDQFRPGLQRIFDEVVKEEELVADLQVNTGATTPVFLNEEERKSSITITGKSVNVVSRSVTSDTNTNVTIVGLATGATYNVAVKVKADPSKL